MLVGWCVPCSTGSASSEAVLALARARTNQQEEGGFPGPRPPVGPVRTPSRNSYVFRCFPRRYGYGKVVPIR